MTLEKAKQLLNIEELGTFLTPSGHGRIRKENGVYVVEHYDEENELVCRVSYADLDTALIDTSEMYY